MIKIRDKKFFDSNINTVYVLDAFLLHYFSNTIKVKVHNRDKTENKLPKKYVILPM